MLLSDKYPFLTKYFETCINNPDANLFHSILLYGNDLEAQYTLAQEIGRLLNCTGDKSDNCECQSCRWAREHQHPAILTYSRKDNRTDDKDNGINISKEQINDIINKMALTSDFHRVYIFCDRDEDGNIKGLNSYNFQEASANALLKSVEEPNPHITFIFLAQDKNDIISTIISRSQCFFVPTKDRQAYNYDSIKNIFENYWTFKRSTALILSEKFQELSKEIPIQEILEQMQNYILTVLKANPKNLKFIQDVKDIELSKKEDILGMKADSIFDELCLKLIQ